MGFVIAGQPIGVLEDLTAKLDQTTMSTDMEVSQSGRQDVVESGEVPMMDEEVYLENASASTESALPVDIKVSPQNPN